MPEGSSSAAPVISPGPRKPRKPRPGTTSRSSRARCGSQTGRRQWRRRVSDGGIASRGIRSQKVAQQLEKAVEPVVMHPMTGALERHHLGALEMLDAAVLLRIGSPAFLAVDEQRRTGDA